MLKLRPEAIPFAGLQRIMSPTVVGWNPLWSYEKTRNFCRKSMAEGAKVRIDWAASDDGLPPMTLLRFWITRRR
jgi:hypothetical protein